MWSPSRIAASSRFSTSAPAASPGTKPSAPRSNARHWPVGDSMPVFDAARADEHAAAAAVQIAAGIAGVVERVACLFEEVALLRVHQLGFARGDVKEERVELLDAAEKAAPLTVRLIRPMRVGIEMGGE